MAIKASTIACSFLSSLVSPQNEYWIVAAGPGYSPLVAAPGEPAAADAALPAGDAVTLGALAGAAVDAPEHAEATKAVTASKEAGNHQAPRFLMSVLIAVRSEE